jgi:tetratricopeptide (TPR) repeat protein
MKNGEERIPLSFAEVYRCARAGAEVHSPFDREVTTVADEAAEPDAADGVHICLRGRHDLLENLVDLARRPDGGPAVLVGEGGAGKSTLAAALADQVRSWSRQVWWVSAADPAAFSLGLADVAADLCGSSTDVTSIARGAVDAPERLWRLLDNAPREWLIVLDNADDPWVLAAAGSPAGIQNGRGWVRASCRGLVVVTSRETDTRMWEAARVFAVGALTTVDAAQVLCDLAPEAGSAPEALALAHRLGGLPLVLHLAGTYLRSAASQCPTFAAYAHAISHADGTMVARAMEISLDGLAGRGLPQARTLMRLAGCYAPTSIPARILPAAGLAEALDGLREVGLVRRKRGGIALHPVLAEVNRVRARGTGVWRTAVGLLAARTAELRFDLPEDWPQYRMVARHVLALLDAAADSADRAHLAVLADAATRTARAFLRSGAALAAGVLGRATLARCAALGEEHPAILRARHVFAWTVAADGDPLRAEGIYRDVLTIRLRVLGDSHPDTLDSRHEYAWIATCLGRWAEAEQRYRDTLRDSLVHRGPDAPETLTTRHELAFAIARQDRLDEACAALAEVLRDRRRVLGGDHAQTLQTEHEIAWITARQGRWAEAERRYRRVLRRRVRVLGNDNPDVLLTRHELAWTIARQGRRTEAETLYRYVLEHRRRTLGEDHPETRTTLHALRELRQDRIVDADHVA